MAAARAGEFTIEPDGSVTLAGVSLAPDEVEIQATPRPGTAVAHHDGLVVVLDTSLTPALVAEGDARELARAVQDLRREAGLELDDRIELWVERLPADVAPHLPTVAADTLAEPGTGEPPPDARRASVELDGGPVGIALRRRPGGR
jgi:isoleucyl-tRNA synthetase